MRPIRRFGSGVEELTHEDNVARVATLRERGTGKHSNFSNRAEVLAWDSPLSQMVDEWEGGKPMSDAVRDALVSPARSLVRVFEVATATKDGDYRKDMVEAMRAQTPQSMALAIPAAAGQRNDSIPVKVKNGNGDGGI